MKKDNSWYLSLAIQKLMPNVNFSFTGSDYSSIVFNSQIDICPSKDEITSVIEQIKIDEITLETKAAAAKIAAQAKLTALGLTTDDLQALGL